MRLFSWSFSVVPLAVLTALAVGCGVPDARFPAFVSDADGGVVSEADASDVVDGGNDAVDSGVMAEDGGSVDAGFHCEDTCQPSDRQCAGDFLQVCERREGGCLGWSSAIQCEAGKVCRFNGACIDEEPPPPMACQSSLACASTEVCRKGVCTSASSLQYKFTMYSADIAPRKPAGATWDSSGGMPDPYAIIRLNGTAIYETRVIDDVTWPVWGETIYQSFNATDELTIEVYDDDGSTSDYIDGMTIQRGTLMQFIHYNDQYFAPMYEGSDTIIRFYITPL